MVMSEKYRRLKTKLDSFIVSNTPSVTMSLLWEMTKDEMEERHILFQEEDRDRYVGRMLEEAAARV